jgi:hypothetical protein
MKTDPKRQAHRDDHTRTKRTRDHQEKALDDALKNTFPASDPISIEQPTMPTSNHKAKA